MIATEEMIAQEQADIVDALPRRSIEPVGFTASPMRAAGGTMKLQPRRAGNFFDPQAATTSGATTALWLRRWRASVLHNASDLR